MTDIVPDLGSRRRRVGIHRFRAASFAADGTGVRVRDAPEALYATMPATASSVTTLRRRLRAFLDGAIDDRDLIDDVALAASEAMENAVDHAYSADRPGGAIRVAACFASTCCDMPTVVVNVSDDGVWREPGAPGYRGRGLDLIGELVAFHSVAAGTDGTCVTMCHPTVNSAATLGQS